VDLRLERLNASAQLVEGARDVAVLGVWREVEGDGTLALEEGELDVVGEEEELWRGGRHGGGEEGGHMAIMGRAVVVVGVGVVVVVAVVVVVSSWWDRAGDERQGSRGTVSRPLPHRAVCIHSRAAHRVWAGGASHPSSSIDTGHSSPPVQVAAPACPGEGLLQLHAPPPPPLDAPMSSPSPIPPPNDRRSSQASTHSQHASALPDVDSRMPVGGPPGSPSPLALRASHSPSARRRQSRGVKVAPEMHALDYAATPDSNLVCLICHTPFVRPVQLACGHYFCRECLDHAWAPHGARRSCPTCRARVDGDGDVRPVPKIVDTMLDELLVRCPNARAGCAWVAQRGTVCDHVLLYCEHTPVECSGPDCRLHIAHKDFHKGCLHYTVTCDDCRASVMKKDLDDHQRTVCPNRTTQCTLCAAELLRLDLKAHLNSTCPRYVVACQGAIVGCKVTAERATVLAHEAACAMATMAPHFREQQARMERTEARLEPLSRKVGILEDGLANITNYLYPSTANDSSYPLTDPLDANDAHAQTPTPDFRLPPASFPPVASAAGSTPAQPPFDSQVHHLLTLHDSLREEVTRIANALTDLDGRTNMMIINESQRAKDEMLHANAAISSMRMHLQWLVSATLHQRSTAAGSSTARASGSTTAAPSQGSETRATPSRPGPSTTSHGPFRRLSDSNRQDTKL